MHVLQKLLRFLAWRFHIIMDTFPTTRAYPHVIKGRYSYFAGPPVVVAAHDDEIVTIGKFCSISTGVTFLAGGDHDVRFISTFPFRAIFGITGRKHEEFSKGKIIVGNDVWIGKNVTILGGVTIGDGAIIGACSVVTHDVDPYTIVAGNPAGMIRARFSFRHIQALLELKWWDWPLSRIIKNVNLLQSENIAAFLERNKPLVVMA